MKQSKILELALEQEQAKTNSAYLLRAILTTKVGRGRGTRKSSAAHVLNVAKNPALDQLKGYMPASKRVLRELEKGEYDSARFEDISLIFRRAEQHRRLRGSTAIELENRIRTENILYALASANPQEYEGARALQSLGFSGKLVDRYIQLVRGANAWAGII